MFVLPTITNPAARSRATQNASTGETTSTHRSDPIVIGIPATARLSLIAIGTPANGRGSPGSIAAAAARAPSGSTNVNALTRGLSRSIASNDASTSSPAEISPARTEAANCTAGRLSSSVTSRER